MRIEARIAKLEGDTPTECQCRGGLRVLWDDLDMAATLGVTQDDRTRCPRCRRPRPELRVRWVDGDEWRRKGGTT